MLCPRAARALIGWDSVSPRLNTARFHERSFNGNISVVHEYAPTNETDPNAEEDFYNTLQGVLASCQTETLSSSWVTSVLKWVEIIPSEKKL